MTDQEWFDMMGLSGWDNPPSDPLSGPMLSTLILNGTIPPDYNSVNGSWPSDNLTPADIFNAQMGSGENYQYDPYAVDTEGWTPADYFNQQMGSGENYAYDPNSGQSGGGILNTIGKILGGGSSGNALGNLINTGANIGSSLLQSSAANKAAEAGAEAAKYAADLQYKAQQEARAELARQYDINQGNIAPWLQSGKLGLTALTSGLGLGENTGTGPVPYGDFNKSFTMADYQADPGYAFRLSEGQKAIDRSAAAKGGALSGGAVKAGMRYASDLASQEYQNAYNRFNADQTNRYNRFASLSGVGQTAANTLGNYGQNYASNVGNILTGTAQNMGDLATQAANARATGYYNSANAWGQGINNIANNVASQILLSQILKGGY